jgi:AhpD family alkylhydroperoxidase
MARMNVTRVAPEGYRVVLALERYVKERIDGRLLELVKVRASMVNGCAFCADMHATDALGAGEDVRRIVALAAWRESPFFTDAERAALDLTDAVTRLGEHGVSDEVWARAVAEHGEEGVADLLFAIAAINVWNRLMVATQASPPPLAG